jgi:hypothetical protein
MKKETVYRIVLIRAGNAAQREAGRPNKSGVQVNP